MNNKIDEQMNEFYKSCGLLGLACAIVIIIIGVAVWFVDNFYCL
jgi:hypothetical protein